MLDIMEYNIKDLTVTEIQECKRVAVERTRAQVKDHKNGIRAAGYSYGRYDSVDARAFEKKINHHTMGTIAEFIASKCAKCIWTKEMNQYKGNKNPDLSPIFRGKIVKCDVRGTKRYNTFIYRPRDVKNPDGLLIAVTNLPEGPDCQVGHAFFKDISEYAEKHPEYLGSHPGEPYYNLPFEVLSGDFSEFGV